ncbi:MAG: methyltransferase domain-containing protein [Silicimonas sp.]|nr:methyltransferase domain-containing protein [Silicimonas sp.]
MAKPGSLARAAAAKAMTAVTKEQVMLRDVFADLSLPPAELARAQRLATNALRFAPRSDQLLGPHLRMKPEDEVMSLLRLAIYEINSGAPAHAAIDGAVDLASKSKKGLINAVLRNVQRTATDWDSLGAPKMPKWLKKPLTKAWGKAAVEAMEAVHATEPPLDLTLKDATQADHWAKELGATILPNGSLRLVKTGQVSNFPGFEDGAWWVQDAGATVAAKLLDAQPGEMILDLCAAPGGKTMQLTAAGSDVTALDISGPRLKRLEQNLQRTGHKANLVTTDALHWEPEAQFDAILLDAPCSATGTLRRHPDLAFAKDGNELTALLPLQAALIDRALTYLKPNGRLIYCTCSLFPDEGEAQIEAALERHALKSTLPNAPWIDPKWRTDLGLRLRPDHWAEIGGIDGFFIARLENRA